MRRATVWWLKCFMKWATSLQANRKTIEGDSHPDRNAQFETINRKAQEYQATSQPVISVDTKKKELVGNFKNSGQELRPQGDPEKVRIYDFLIPQLGRVSPYGIYDIARNAGWVNVGTDHDTSAFASPSKASAAGGIRWDSKAIRKQQSS